MSADLYPDLLSLLVLQEREQRLAAVQAEIDKLPRAKAEAQERVAAHEREADARRVQLRQLESARKRHELEVATRRTLIAKYERQKFEARKAEEIAALDHAIAQEQLDIARIEDEELTLMMEADDLQKAVSEAEQAVVEEKKLVEQLVREWSEREKKFLGLKAGAEAALAEAEKAVSDEALDRYDRIARAKTPVLVPVRVGTCGGCHMTLPPQTVVNVRVGKMLATCPSCSRILFISE